MEESSRSNGREWNQMEDGEEEGRMVEMGVSQVGAIVIQTSQLQVAQRREEWSWLLNGKEPE